MTRTLLSAFVGLSMLAAAAESSAKDPPQEAALPAAMVVKPIEPEVARQLAEKLLTPGGLTMQLPGAGQAVVPAAAPCKPPLTADSLKQMLEDMGYAPQFQNIGAGWKQSLIKVTRNNMDVAVAY